MDFKRVSRIPIKYSDIVNGFVKEVEAVLPRDTSYYNIVDLIKHLILLYFYSFIESQLLTEDEINQIFNLFKSNNKDIVNQSWKLIYESKEDGLEKDKFIKNVHDKQNIVFLAKLKRHTIIGGYTKHGWIKQASSGYGYVNVCYTADKDAFVFYVKSPENYESFICNVEQDEESICNALGYHQNGYGNFGYRWIFYVDASSKQFIVQSFSTRYEAYANYQSFSHGKDCLDGQDAFVTNVYQRPEFEFEVFQIQIE